ncbi:MAG: hypothetical protein FWC25_02860, partial [Dehalococcoidia bacterium]|nr:hypothetical protein [Dehalococcoidia bacterium]
MNIHLLSVCNTGYASGRRPGFYIYADWLPSMGFIPGALVQTLPTPEEMVFNLCDENIRRYSELDAETKAQGGKLLQVFNASEKYQQSPTLLASGQFLHDAGFTYGDSLVAKYEYGHIRVRKLSGKLKMVSLSSIRDNHTGKMTPKIRMSGGWL